MATLTFIFGLIIIAINFHVGFLYMKLNKANIIVTYKRISWKILKSALLKTDNQSDKDEIIKCFNAYKILLVCFYIELILIVITLVLSADT
jgi:hypothetical protein